jgi:hypothetical protein
MTIYLELTKEFNTGKLRSVLSSGQAAVLHRIAIMSKDGDWILREDAETMKHVLAVLSKHDARYRYGAPLDMRWMSGGWSSHFEFPHQRLRVRTDFVTRPPRISEAELKILWKEQEGRELPFVNVRQLAELKKTNREKDYAVIGELARLMTEPRDKLLYSRSARDLINLAETHPRLILELAAIRPVLSAIHEGRSRLEEALDAERRSLMHANEERLKTYLKAAEKWAETWTSVAKEIAGLPLAQAHEVVAYRADAVLPSYP